jgi:hypothetical protein
MDEATFRPDVLAALKPLDAFHVENAFRAGTPDVNYVEGWLELKWLSSWPKLAPTPLRLPDFTAQQRVFLHKRCQAGGQARVLLRVGKEWILLPGMWSAWHLGRVATKSAVLAAAELHFPRRLDAAALVAHLRNPPPPVEDWSRFLKESASTSCALEKA